MNNDKFKLIPAVALIIEQKGKLLLVKRSKSCTWPGYYCNIGGHVDGNETIREAACREAFEEIGIVVNPEDLQFVHVVHRYHEAGEVICFFFKVVQFQGKIYNKEPEKHEELIWASLDNLPEPLFPTFKTYLENTEQMYSEFGWNRRP